MSSIEITTSWSQMGFVVVSSVLMLAGIIGFVRLIGLRSFSKMSSFDFAVTVAMGSVLAAVALSGSSLIEGLVAAGALLGFQALISLGRSRLGLSSLIDNEPLLLMIGGHMVEENLRRSRVTADDVRAKLRAANVRNYDQLRYVVLETTGDVSVVHGDGDLEPDIVADIINGERVFDAR